MGTSRGEFAFAVEENGARDYYRRAGFSRLAIRDKPSIQDSDIVPIRETYLKLGDIAHLVVYPELGLRDRPWRIWGEVIKATDTAFIVKQLTGEAKNTIAIVPYRYFRDDRVYRRDSN